MITFPDHHHNKRKKTKAKHESELQEQAVLEIDANMIPLNSRLKDSKREERKRSQQRNSKQSQKQRATNHGVEPLLMAIPRSQPLHLDPSPTSPLQDDLSSERTPSPIQSLMVSSSIQKLSVDTLESSHTLPMSPTTNIQSDEDESILSPHGATSEQITLRNCFSLLRTVPKLFDNQSSGSLEKMQRHDGHVLTRRR